MLSVDVQAKDTLTRFCCLSPQNPEGFRLLCELLRGRPAGDERDAELLTAAMHLARIDPWSDEARRCLRGLGKLPEEGDETAPLLVVASEPAAQQLVAGAERHGKRKKRRREQSEVEKEVHHQ